MLAQACMRFHPHYSVVTRFQAPSKIACLILFFGRWLEQSRQALLSDSYAFHPVQTLTTSQATEVMVR